LHNFLTESRRTNNVRQHYFQGDKIAVEFYPETSDQQFKIVEKEMKKAGYCTLSVSNIGEYSAIFLEE